MKFRSQKGVAAMEFAIVLPILILLILGIFEFGLVLYNQQMITNASREGARAGIVRDGPYGNPVPASEIVMIVNSYCANHLVTFGGPNTPTIPPPTPCPTGPYSPTSPTDLTVTVNFHYTYLALPDFVSSLIGGTDLTAESVMRCE